MEFLTFEWDSNKNKQNQLKHNVSFEEAQSVFYDLDAIVFDDPEHSENEDRFLIVGLTTRARICIVSHCYRSNDSIIRIISARKATKNEQKYYDSQKKG